MKTMKRSLRRRQERQPRRDFTIERPDRYGEFLEAVFGHPVNAENRRGIDTGPDFEAPDVDIARLFTACLQRAGDDLGYFSDESLGRGLSFLFMTHDADYAFQTISGCNTLERQLQAIDAIACLYRDCLDRRAAPVLGHQNKSRDIADGVSRPHSLDTFVYMVWDVTPLDCWIAVKDPVSGRSALIEAFGKVLNLANPACVESALHGLGHMHLSHATYRPQIEAAIDRFLQSRPAARQELRDYARAARRGYVL